MSLLGTSPPPDYLPQGHCYAWDPDVLWLHAGANAVIAGAFMVITVALFLFVTRQKSGLPHRDIFYLFIAFIFFTGIAHVAEVATVWIPLYPIRGWLLATAASVCLITALVLIAKLPEAVTNPSPNGEHESLKEELHSLEMRVKQMSALHEASLGREDRITELKKEVNAELIRQGLAARYNIIEAPQ